MSALEALRESLGDDLVELHEPRLLEDASLGASLRPRDDDELSRALGTLSEARLPVLVRGGGTRLPLGNPCPGARALLSTERLVGIDEFDPQDGVIHARAGTPLAVLDEAVAEAGWELPFDPPGASTTIGGVIAAAATGPRRQKFGAPRDSVLGLEVVLASGEVTRCGGRVVKNVTGYDMAKLFTGSFGSLGVISGAWLRARPRPRARRSALALLSGSEPEASLRLAGAASRRSSARVVALVHGDPALGLGDPTDEAVGGRLVVEFAGEDPEVERDLDWLREQPGLRLQSETDHVVAGLRTLQGSGEVRVRLSALPSRLPGLLSALLANGSGCVSYPGLGLVYVLGGVDVETVLQAARAAHAEWLFEALPVEQRREVDVFGEPGDGFPIARALKARFDPLRILNRGRFQGRL